MREIGTWIWLIPLLPLAGAILAAALGRAPRLAAALVVAGAAGAAALALWALNLQIHHPAAVLIPGYDWLSVGTLTSFISARLDPLAAIMLATVSVVSLLVIIYSLGYMAGDPGYARFFASMSLFLFSMLMLVLADNFLMLYIFWEAVGLCSYLLIGFYYHKPAAAAAAKKAFIVNRVGDFGFAIGILLIFLNFGQVDFTQVFSAAPNLAQSDPRLLTLITLCLFAGAVGKSAQFPLYVWLPDAMEGPSPVSALIHAATMVTAGVYMVVRCGALFAAAPATLLVIALIGCFNALFAAIIALAQTDIKRILAYSTISQLGYMFLAVGAGAAAAGVFHLYTHAFFKALLFLAAGSIMHAMAGHINLGELSGLRKLLPWTHGAFLVGALALGGVPLFSGFFSKDAILAAALNHPQLAPLGWVALFTAGLTTFYIFRAFFLTFYGSIYHPPDVKHPHESCVMNFSMAVLALGAILAGYINVRPDGRLEKFLNLSPSVQPYLQRAPDIHLFSHAAVSILSSAVVFAGLLLAGIIYLPGRERSLKIAQKLGILHFLVYRKFFVDELYDLIFVRPLRLLGRAFNTNDNRVIDTLLWAITLVPRTLGAALGLTQRGLLQGYALLMLLLIALLALLLFF